MNKMLLVALLTFKESLRNKALYGIFFLGILLLAFNIIFTGMFTWEVGKVAVDMGLSAISFSGLLIIFFFSIQAMSNDLEKKTIYLILSRPISKAHYILGKFIGLGAVIIVSSTILGICAVISVKLAFLGAEAFIPANFTWTIFFYSILFQTLSLLVTLSFSLLWVFMTSHSFLAFLLSLMTYFIGQNMENVKNIILSTNIMESDAFSIKTINLVSWILPNLAAFNIKTNAAYGLPVNFSSLSCIALYGISYIMICIILSAIIFKRREIA